MNRILTLYSRLFVLWVVLFGILAYGCPQPFVRVTPITPWFFALTMFGIGALLQPSDFSNILRRPWLVVLGTAAQFTIMPFGGFLLARAFRLPPDLALGLILTGAAPGAMASNVMSYLAKADTAYAVSLTVASTLLCPVMTPGLTKVLAGAYMEVDFWAMFRSIVIQVIVPLFVGLGVRYYFHAFMLRIEKVFPAISVTFIVFICAGVIASNQQYLAKELTGVVVVVCCCLNIGGMLGGYGVGLLFRLDVPKRRTLAIEIGMQNAGLGTALAVQHFGASAAVPCAIFVFVCIFTASAMARIWNRKAPPPGETVPAWPCA